MVRNPTCPCIRAYQLSVWYIILGVVIVQFFQCMSALLNRTRRDIKWVLVAHTVTMFSCVTTGTAGGLYIQSIDNREFPGSDVMPPGPVGYEYLIATDPSSYVLLEPVACRRPFGVFYFEANRSGD